jgi:transcriptional regulator with XRE-family HTH domain
MRGTAEEIVGPTLRALRERFGISQRALAKRAGVPPSSVSLIESGRSSPSVGSLKRILEPLGVSLADFFTLDIVKQEKGVFFTADELTEIGRGLISLKQIGSRPQDSGLQILYETYQPGADTGRVPLVHAGFEGGLIISGELEVTVAQDKKILRSGDAFLFPSDQPHRFRNISDSPCTVFTATSPPSF